MVDSAMTARGAGAIPTQDEQEEHVATPGMKFGSMPCEQSRREYSRARITGRRRAGAIAISSAIYACEITAIHTPAYGGRLRSVSSGWPNESIILATPLMSRAHETLDAASGIVFAGATGNFDAWNYHD